MNRLSGVTLSTSTNSKKIVRGWGWGGGTYGENPVIISSDSHIIKSNFNPKESFSTQKSWDQLIMNVAAWNNPDIIKLNRFNERSS